MQAKILVKSVIFLSVLSLSMLPDTAVADNTTTTGKDKTMSKTESLAGFTIEEVLPKNQIDPSVSYYHLDVKPNMKQTIEIKIANLSEEKQTYTIQIGNAATNRNGLLTYDEYEKEPDPSMAVPFTSVAEPVQKEVVVEAWEEGIAQVKLSIPKKPFEGIILGGIRVSLKPKGEEEVNGGPSVKNTYGYVKGVTLSIGKDVPVFGETQVELAGVSAELDYGSKIMEARLLNPHPEVIKELTVEGSLSKKGSNTVINERKIEDTRIAPNAIFPFHIDWGKIEVAPGTYVFTGKATTAEKEWPFEEEFTITKEHAEKINKESVFKIIIPEYFNTAALYLAGASVIMTGWMMSRLIRRQGKKKRRSVV